MKSDSLCIWGNFNHMLEMCSKALILSRAKNVEKNFVLENIRKTNFRTKKCSETRAHITRYVYSELRNSILCVRYPTPRDHKSGIFVSRTVTQFRKTEQKNITQ